MSVSVLIGYAMALVGTPYKYGGNNPITGLDCSGLVTEIMKAAGEVPFNADMSAQALFDKYYNNSSAGMVQPGSLVFYGENTQKITHVGFMINGYQMVEAGGGDHLTLTESDAAARNAFVRIRHYQYRKDFLIALKPYYARIGMAQL